MKLSAVLALASALAVVHAVHAQDAPVRHLRAAMQQEGNAQFSWSHHLARMEGHHRAQKGKPSPISKDDKQTSSPSTTKSEDKPSGGKLSEDQPSTKKGDDKPSGGKPSEGKSSEGKLNNGGPASEEKGTRPPSGSTTTPQANETGGGTGTSNGIGPRNEPGVGSPGSENGKQGDTENKQLNTPQNLPTGNAPRTKEPKQDNTSQNLPAGSPPTTNDGSRPPASDEDKTLAPPRGRAMDIAAGRSTSQPLVKMESHHRNVHAPVRPYARMEAHYHSVHVQGKPRAKMEAHHHASHPDANPRAKLEATKAHGPGAKMESHHHASHHHAKPHA